MIRSVHFALSISIGLATLILALAYALNVSVALAFIIVACGLLWLVGAWLDWRWTAPLNFVLFSGAAALGIWLKLPSDWMLVGIVTTLIAWDLQHFTERLSAAERVEGDRALKRAHLQRLIIVASLGLLLGEITLRVKLSLTLGWALLLGSLAVLGLSAAIRFLRRESA